MAAARGAHKPSLSPPRRGCPGSLGVSRKPGWRAMGAHPLRALPLLRLLQLLLLIMKTPGMRACWGGQRDSCPQKGLRGLSRPAGSAARRTSKRRQAGNRPRGPLPLSPPQLAGWGRPFPHGASSWGLLRALGPSWRAPGVDSTVCIPPHSSGKLRPGGGKDLPKPSSPSPGKLVPAGRRARQPPFLQSLRDPSSELASRRYPGSWSCGGRSGPHSPPEGSSGDLGGLECGAARVWQAAAAAAR